MKTYTITQQQMDRLHGAAHGGAMLGGDAAYEGCLKVEGLLSEIAISEGTKIADAESRVSMTELCEVIYKAGTKGTVGVAEAILRKFHVAPKHS